jgi:hypothetical protein
VLEHNCAQAYTLHPTSLPDVLRNESSPNRYVLQWTPTRGGFETDAAGIEISVDAKMVKEPRI